ncbi:MAG: hypothetical protein SFY66_24695 [Oculatellaceae cyanobacterium bins.114]|nr:hypothetical protein [Oculatellaceae cyanobacterium bins.114]
MNQSQQDLRRAAAKAFMESLDQLGMSLSSSEEVAPEVKTAPAPKPTSASQAMSVEELEAAVADIEQFIQEIQKQSDEP